jgi:hypothetical protein
MRNRLFRADKRLIIPRSSVKHPTLWKFEHVSPEGDILWSQGWTPNALANEGEQYVLETAFRGGTAHANFYIGLINDAGIAETDTLATMAGEPSGNGYARSLCTFGATSLVGGDYETDSTQETFTSSGTIGPVDHAFLTDASSGTTGDFLAYVPLSTPRTMASGESLNVTVTISLA